MCVCQWGLNHLDLLPVNFLPCQAQHGHFLISALLHTICSVSHQIRIDPSNAYNLEEEAVDWRIFDRVEEVPLELAGMVGVGGAG